MEKKGRDHISTEALNTTLKYKQQWQEEDRTGRDQEQAQQREPPAHRVPEVTIEVTIPKSSQ